MPKKESLKILAATHTWFEATTCVIPEVEREIGLEVHVDYVDDEWEMYLQCKKKITAEHSDYDLFMVDSIWVYEYAALDMLECLDGYVRGPDVPRDFDFDDLIPQYLDHFCTVNDRLFCLPLSGHTNFLAFRKDLFRERGLQVPTTQEELLLCAEALHSDELSGITFRGRGFELAYTYMLFLYPNGGRLLDHNCRPCLDTEEALETLQYLKHLWRFTPAGIFGNSFPDMASDFMNGRAAIFHDASVGAILHKDCPLAERFGYAPPPAGREVKTSVAGWGMGIPKAARHKREAFLYLLLADGKGYAEEILRRGRDPIRLSTFRNENLRREYPFLEATEQSLNHGSPWFRPPIPVLAGAISLLGDCISPVLKGDYEAAEGLNKAQKGIQELLKKAGY